MRLTPRSVARIFRGLVAACICLAGCQRAERLNGGGSSFVYPAMLQWSRVYDRLQGVQIDYQSTGSGNGVQQMIVRTIDFGCTDAPMTPDQRKSAQARGGAVVHIPLVMGGVVPVYNLPELPAGRPLRFSGPVLADIMLGAVTRWNDPALAELNPGVALPEQSILVVGRSDPSGTTAIFADYLQKQRPELWAERDMATGTAVRWPVGEFQKGNEGVVGLVRRVPGAFGYVELKYAHDVGLPFGVVRNRAGHFITASPDSIRAAAEALGEPPEDLTFSLTDRDGPDAYPISGTVWAVFYAEQPPDRGTALARFLRWATDPNTGQTYARALGYGPLPAALVERVREKLARLEGGGAP